VAASTTPSSSLASHGLRTDWLSVEWIVNFTVHVTSAAATGQSINGALTFDIDSGRFLTTVNVTLPSGASSISAAVNVTGVAPWWPANLGSQQLYNTTVKLVTVLPGREEADSHSLRLGFREIAQVSSHVDFRKR
jgi:hypothetical protein